jgi:dihydroorotase
MPPLRDEKNKKALLRGLKDGTIDVISSDHKPQDYDEKVLEFGRSSFGAIGLETAFPISLMATGDLDLTIDKLVSGPRKVLGIDIPVIKKGVSAEITIFDPKKSWEVNKDSLHSKSFNTPYLGKTLNGKAIGVIRDGKVFLA